MALRGISSASCIRIPPAPLQPRMSQFLSRSSFPCLPCGSCRKYTNTLLNVKGMYGIMNSARNYDRRFRVLSHSLSDPWNPSVHLLTTSFSLRTKFLFCELDSKRFYSYGNVNRSYASYSSKRNRPVISVNGNEADGHSLIGLFRKSQPANSASNDTNSDYVFKVVDMPSRNSSKKSSTSTEGSGKKGKIKSNKNKHDSDERQSVNEGFGKKGEIKSNKDKHDSGEKKLISKGSGKKGKIKSNKNKLDSDEKQLVNEGSGKKGKIKSNKNKHDSDEKQLVNEGSVKKGKIMSNKSKLDSNEMQLVNESSGKKGKIKSNKNGHDSNEKQLANEKAKNIDKKISTSVSRTQSKRSQQNKRDASAVSIDTKPHISHFNDDASSGSGELVSLWPPSKRSVMVVESSTKAKTIQNYLGDMFDVLPSYGHVRDLAGRSGSVRPHDDFSMVWEVPESAWPHLKAIKGYLSGAKNLILASDPDREGEAIAWHIIEMLHQQDALNENISVARVVFHEVTEKAIKDALQSPRKLDLNLVNAYLARRALDYLIGFSVSPLLWKKLPGCHSAGRVQSAALSIICDREIEIDQFKPKEYWSIGAEFCKSNDRAAITSRLYSLDSKRLTQLSISSQESADSIEKRLESVKFSVLRNNESEEARKPPLPYITSSLQQDSSNKLGFSSEKTMKLAQKLYEGVSLEDKQAMGLITYTRTDGYNISVTAVKDIRALVRERYGDKFVPKITRKVSKKVKNAQEAHEAIRPTCIRRLPSSLIGILDDDCLKLYALIWTRTVACQMESAINGLVQVDIGTTGEDIVFRSTSTQIKFLGYQAVYQDPEAAFFRQADGDKDAGNEFFKILDCLKSGEHLKLKKVLVDQHSTKPPPRYSDGSLVKRLEELGIGRPSTYATIPKTLRERGYVTMKKNAMYPEFRGRMVSSFLSEYFHEVFECGFTANMENELDNISAGTTEWKSLLNNYWTKFKKYCDLAGNVHIHQLEKLLEKKFELVLFNSLPSSSRVCPSCSVGTLRFKVSRYGSGYFVGCDQHPECRYIAKTVINENTEDDSDDVPMKPDNCPQPKLLGLYPSSNEKIFLKKGPFGYYVQLGEDRKECPPKRRSLSEIKDIDSFTLADALELLSYPITVGNHPEDDRPVLLTHSKYGYCVRHKNMVAHLKKNDDPKMITLEKALKLLSSKKVTVVGRRKTKEKSL